MLMSSQFDHFSIFKVHHILILQFKNDFSSKLETENMKYIYQDQFVN